MIHLLFGAFQTAFQALPVLLFTLAFIVMTGSSAVYMVEPRENFETLPKALWFTVVTMTTVGYGDMTPTSTVGRCIVGLLMITGVLYMAMPLGIVGHAFTEVWKDRHDILIVKKARSAMAQWGFTAHDIPTLCQVYDTDGLGALNMNDFRRMIHQIIGMKDESAVQLFFYMDEDGSGTVDDQEIVSHLFPRDYCEVYLRPDSVKKLSAGRAEFCPCGNKLMPDAVFCRKCGKKVEQKPVAPSAEYQVTLPDRLPSTSSLPQRRRSRVQSQ